MVSTQPELGTYRDSRPYYDLNYGKTTEYLFIFILFKNNVNTRFLHASIRPPSASKVIKLSAHCKQYNTNYTL